jgi:hypothetical protein
MSSTPLTAAQIRKLPWPKALFGDLPLSAEECFQVGQIIVERVQSDGSVRARARKAWSVRRLQQELGVASAATFTRCIQVYDMARELRLKRPLQGVTASSLFLVAGLPKAVRQKVARQAVSENWSKRQIELELSNTIGRRATGRPPGPGCIKSLHHCMRRPLTTDLDKVTELDNSTRKTVNKQVKKLISDAEELKRQISKASRKS